MKILAEIELPNASIPGTPAEAAEQLQSWLDDDVNFYGEAGGVTVRVLSMERSPTLPRP
jgi:hypothetical protein